MVLPLLYDALSAMENFRLSSDGRNCTIKCPFCGGSSKDISSLSIKIDVDKGEPIWYQCFRASCGVKGALNTTKLQEMGITDIDTVLELAQYNKTLGANFDKPFITKKKREYVTVNLPIKSNTAKLAYINGRLGTKLTCTELSQFKIQLSLMEMLRVNDIKRLAVSRDKAAILDAYSIGFVSMFDDYLICRDITPDKKTGMRYYMYRISGKPDPNDLKIYSIPREIDILDPRSAIINVAEGPFSILGAYLHTDIGTERKNSIWVANCGSQYTNTIMRICKQYGLLKVRLNIWSDSEIKIGFYRKLYSQLKNRLDIRRMTVYYNSKKEDFGHAKKDISIEAVSLKDP